MPSDSFVHAAAGAGGGAAAMAVTYPLINISTRAQVETKKHPGEGTKQAVLRIIKKDGISGLYDGLSSSLLGIAVTNGIYYLFFEESRDVILRAQTGKNSKKGQLSTLESMLAGAIAGSMTSIISNPIWVVNTRQTVRSTLDSTSDSELSKSTTAPSDISTSSTEAQVTKTKKLSFWQTVFEILKKDGAGTFFHGLGPALILVINPIIQYTIFEQFKNMLIARRSLLAKTNAKKVPPSSSTPSPSLTDLDYFLLGAISKLFATGFTYPYLTIKSRMQAGQKEGKSYKNSWDGLKRIVENDGIEGLYRGVGPKLTQSVLTAAILFASKERIYQITKRLLLASAKPTSVKS